MYSCEAFFAALSTANINRITALDGDRLDWVSGSRRAIRVQARSSACITKLKPCAFRVSRQVTFWASPSECTHIDCSESSH